MRLKAFSLIELLVVVAIIAILASLAIPAYTMYGNRVLVGKAMTEMQSLGQTAANIYAKTGSWPSGNITWGGYTLPYSTYVTTPNLNSAGIYYIRYDTSTSTGTLRLVAAITGLKSLGNSYTDPSVLQNNNIGNGNGFMMEFAEQNGQIVMQCGWSVPSGDTNNIVKSVLPSNCTCMHLNNFYTSNGSASSCP